MTRLCRSISDVSGMLRLFVYTKGKDMIEIHGWLRVEATYKNEDMLSQADTDSIMKSAVDILSACGRKGDMRCANGCVYINTLHCSNHRTAEVDELIGMYIRISETATGSYGILYIRDDEDERYYNGFQVYIFRKGICIRRNDTDFSPCIPVIEDE